MKILLIFLFVFCLNITTTTWVDFNKSDCIEVEVRGAVESDKSLCLAPFSTIEDAFQHVKLLETADLTSVNKKTVIHHGDVIQVPIRSETQKISLNFSTKEELMTLPGVGGSTADKIITYRNQFGLFKQVEDIMKIPGIKEAKFNKLKDFICL